MQNLVFHNSDVSGNGNKLEDQITAVLWFKKQNKKPTQNIWKSGTIGYYNFFCLKNIALIYKQYNLWKRHCWAVSILVWKFNFSSNLFTGGHHSISSYVCVIMNNRVAVDGIGYFKAVSLNALGLLLKMRN